MTTHTITPPPSTPTTCPVDVHPTSAARIRPSDDRRPISDEEVIDLLGRTPQPHVLYTKLELCLPPSDSAKLKILKRAQERIEAIGTLSTPGNGTRSHDTQEFNAWMTVLGRIFPEQMNQWTLEKFDIKSFENYVASFSDARGLTEQTAPATEAPQSHAPAL